MKISKDELLERINTAYIKRKIAKGHDFRYAAPEQMPQIVSDQVLALVDTMYELGVLDDQKD